jgi:carbamate kinase
VVIRVDAPPLLVVALGGNAMQNPSGDDSVESDFATTTATARRLAALVAAGSWRLAVTHGNGPQVGNHLLRSELGHERGGLPDLPLEVCVADTQGGMGYVLQQCLTNALQEAGVLGVVATVVTQVVVDPDDPAFGSPSKPVGEMISSAKVDDLKARGWRLAEDHHRGGFRRVVASPDPLEIVEAAAIRTLLDDGVVVVAAGGGGIPVAQMRDGSLRGVPAVVDKDLASALLAVDLDAAALLILTDIDRVYVGFDSPRRSALTDVSVPDLRGHQAAGEFGEGSMGPKVEACCRFVEATRRSAFIGPVDGAADTLEGKVGTRIHP